MIVNRLDHLVLTVQNVEISVDFYQRVLGMKKELFSTGRIALSFGDQKINLHESGREFEPKAGMVQVGSADLCFIIEAPLSEAVIHLQNCNVEVLEGPVRRTGALGPIMSLYFRDPDMNLIEVSNYL
ncbi:VOC family protein [Neptunomonas japonica]|uniref:Glyoxalase family protein n=1 Tax=Neptunomonas japonica JAMM 1380 TaxID=1441457 RepID=A0A7R6PBM7_9GAMM|nr:VOC family protein [Neptunomonas japonica]BBB30739.1 glyoxalase family protein [Neptunomonas japonica JAMM 1380]